MRKVQLRLVVAAAFNDGIDNISLAPLRHLLAHEVPDIVGALLGHATRDDGGASGRQLVENADIEIAVERKGKRARNRSCRHHQHVGFGLIRLLHQLEALQHAEAVLLINYDQAKAIEFHFFFDQRMGADDQLRFAAIDQAAVGALAVFIERTGEQDDAILSR